MLRLWILSPLLGALIGLFTNWLAIKMLFRPHEEKRILGLRLPFTPGLIPRERLQLANKLGETLGEKVLTPEAMEQAIRESGIAEKIWAQAAAYLNNLAKRGETLKSLFSRLPGGEDAAVDLLNKLAPPIKSALPSISAYIRALDKNQPKADSALRQMAARAARENFGGFIGIFVNYEKIYDNIKNSLCDYLDNPANDISLKASGLLTSLLSSNYGEITVKELFEKLPDGAIELIKPRVMESAASVLKKSGAFLAESLDIAGIAEQRLNAYNMAEAEKIIIGVVNKELRMITLLGGLLGLIIGLASPVLAILTR